ncbi:hypothetical protein J3R82DRAFT_4783 [Butyriboletus roseoflavus]|nr:hypothetical protein J3R82DRAFT_4783 [Butyriboletus roseoflavus]
MYTPQVDVSSMFNSPSAIMPSFSSDKPPRFSLDMSGIMGLMGGDDAVSAMATVHVYGNRRWLGWYNTPGSFQIAKRLRTFAKSASFRNIFSRDLSSKFLSKSGPKFRAAYSGTVIEETSYLAALFMKECAAWNSEGKVVPGRMTQPVGLTIAELGPAPASEMHPARSSAFTLLLASLPIAVSISMCALCALCEDWYASLLILVGIIASGVSCLVLGSADFVFTHPEPAKGSPAGDGILGSDKEFVLLRGTEGAVNAVTRGMFSLRFSSDGPLQSDPVHRCSAKSCSSARWVSPAMYSALLSSLDKEKIHRQLLFDRVLESPPLSKYTLGTRTTAVVFMLLVLRLPDPTRHLNEFLPNDTKVWKAWKATILERLRHLDDPSFSFESQVGDLDGFTQQEKDLLGLLYEDARAAYHGYREYLRVDAL